MCYISVAYIVYKGGLDCMKDDKALREVLREKIAIIQNKLPRTAFEDIQQEMYNRFNVKSDKTIDIFNGFEPMETVPYHMLYKLMIAIKEVSIKRGDFDYLELNEDQYFNENEIPEYLKPIKTKDEDFDIVITDWHQTNVGMYSYITIYPDVNEVIKWRDYNKLRFNPETQRDLIVIETNGIPIKKLDINYKSVKQMQDKMLKGKYKPVPGALNINPELYDEYPLEIKNGKLIIKRKFKIDLVEGFHNYLAYTGAKDKSVRDNIDWNYPCEFRLYFMNVDDANEYILQMDFKNHLNETQTTRIDTENPYNYFITTINKSNKFYLVGTIDSNMNLYLFKIATKIYKIDNIPDAAKLISTTIPNLNYLITQTDHFKSPFTKEEWFVFLYLSQQSINIKIDFEKLIDNIGINSLFSDIKIKNEPLSKHYKILDNAISEVIKNV
jgi:hypothetical protein